MKNYFQIRLSAGSLQYAIFVSVIIALLITALISTTYLHQKLAIKTNYYLKSIESTNQAFRLLPTYPLEYNIPFKAQIDKSDLTIQKSHWGLFDYVTIYSEISKESFTKNALIGSACNDILALYLQDKNRSLAVVGETKIIGKTFLPQAGVKRGNMGGHSYYGTDLIYGQTTTSLSNLPKLLNRNYLFGFNKYIGNKISRYININERDVWINSFKNSLLIYHSSSIIDLSFKKLSGRMIIQSDTLVRIHPTSKLNNIIVIAPYIEISDNTTSTFQAIAGKSISVGKNVTLSYPSGLLLVDKSSTQTATQQNSFPNIIVGDNSHIKGMLVYLTKEDNTNNHKAQIQIATTSQITGEVYCERNLELKGRVNGSVYTQGFVANEFGSIYQNHIYNGIIDITTLPQEYVGLLLENKNPKVAHWAY